jgi:hypothetical protein
MDRAGLRELIKSGVTRATRRIGVLRESEEGLGGLAHDLIFVSTLDRMTDLGLLLVEHDAREPWSDLLEGLLTAFRLPEYEQLLVSPTLAGSYGAFFSTMSDRLLTLGAAAVRARRYALAAQLARQEPLDGQYWLRDCHTLSARANRSLGTNLIAPAVSFVGSRPDILAALGGNLDDVTDQMCQFDLFQCVLLLAHHGRDACYPTFSKFYNHRASPMAQRMVESAQLRRLLGMDVGRLADVLRDLDSYAAAEGRAVAGWRAGVWPEPVKHFLQQQALGLPSPALVGVPA